MKTFLVIVVCVGAVCLFSTGGMGQSYNDWKGACANVGKNIDSNRAIRASSGAVAKAYNQYEQCLHH